MQLNFDVNEIMSLPSGNRVSSAIIRAARLLVHSEVSELGPRDLLHGVPFQQTDVPPRRGESY